MSYETDLEFVVDLAEAEADEYLGDEMGTRIEQYRDRLAETPAGIEVRDLPSVNLLQAESWVELRLRYLAHPKRGQRVKNEPHRRVLSRFNDNPDRVSVPVGRNG